MRYFPLLTLCAFFMLPTLTFAQVNYTANDRVTPYKAPFGYGTNVGWFPNWSQEELADITFGNPDKDVDGVGITTMRPALFEHFMDTWGYEFRIPTFEHYKRLGAKDNVVFVGYPAQKHRDQTEYCDGTQSELFRNLYTPIWDNGANGTPYNDENYYAAYLYKTVTLYKEYVKFWEIWNEPDYSFTPNSIHAPGVEGNWWEYDPEPCDYDIHAPVQHYIRMLRISWEIIKTVDPEAYVAIGGIGYPSFLDAVLRQTDNPNGGEVTENYPLKGGAYFDVLSYHTYPHIDNSLRKWNNAVGGFVYFRHTDAAVQGVLKLRDRFEEVLYRYGYDGAQYPEKEWIITESNVPRKPLNRGFGSDEVQRNFIIKALVESQKHNIHQFHIFTLGDKMEYGQAKDIYDEYHIMGLFKNMFQAKLGSQKPNDIGIAYKTTSELLYGKYFDHAAFERLDLPEGINGGVFKGDTGKEVYVLWAETKTDKSESSLRVVNFKEFSGINKFIKKEWDHAITGDSTAVDARYVSLTGEPAFFTEVGGLNGDNDGGGGVDPRDPTSPYTVEIYPNPFAVEINIAFRLVTADRVRMEIVDHIGRPVKVLLDDDELDPGNYTWSLDGSIFKPGIYFLKYRTRNVNQTKKVLLIRSKE
ncbi:MAG: T9SS type A sorting domain-containing protein [Bacteroidota bacterium]